MTEHTNPTGQTPLIVPADPVARHRLIIGLRALAVFLEANPAVPVNTCGNDLLVSVRAGDDASSAAVVDQVAALLGVKVADDTDQGGHYTANRDFGGISYRIVHIPDQRRREHHALNSYRPNIVLDTTPHSDDQDAGWAA
ncbi:hypothetical protein D0T12_22245 [Actinomadura spongiicola]|uniref:Uncharacterized protein n=1 Tax=Actinomadura spongiicola TaxID=2303421 RepID=A0A372GF80_9ACTN|nr:hypothetical protein [Actinomadura spongiicola]RFS83733.1 hypothetical protein D0T12_22245 [Actinomadura spongiicola]